MSAIPRPVLLVHSDGTDCCHLGPPQRLASDDTAPVCSAGIEITHVRFDGRTVPVAEAFGALRQLGQRIADTLAPAIAQMTQRLAEISSTAHMRILAETATAVERERRQELSDPADYL